MALYRWPTDPKGKPARHTVPYGVKQGLQGTRISGQKVSVADYKGGALLRALTGGRAFDPHTGVAPAAPDPAAPATPPAGPVPPAALPVDPVYLAQMGSLERQRELGYADVTGERTRGLSDYGYKEGAIGPKTGYGALSIDPNNPFSKAALLKRNY